MVDYIDDIDTNKLFFLDGRTEASCQTDGPKLLHKQTQVATVEGIDNDLIDEVNIY